MSPELHLQPVCGTFRKYLSPPSWRHDERAKTNFPYYEQTEMPPRLWRHELIYRQFVTEMK